MTCPAEGKTCTKCKKLNHFARVCKAKFQERKRDVHRVERITMSGNYDVYEKFSSTTEVLFFT